MDPPKDRILAPYNREGYAPTHPRSMLYRPIYLKGGGEMKESLIPVGKPPPSPPPQPHAPTPPSELSVEEDQEYEDRVVEEEIDRDRLPMLIAR